MRKRFLSILTALALALSLLPVTALAAGESTEGLPTPDGNNVYTLSADTTVTSVGWPQTSAAIDLGGHTLTMSGGDTVNIPEGQTLTIKNGTIEANQYASTKGVFCAEKDASIVLEGVTMNTTGSALFPAGNAASVTVTGSKITAGAYVVGTNASTQDGQLIYSDDVAILMEDSTFDTTGSNQNYDSCTLMINVPGTLTVDNCIVKGHRQAVLVRGGTASITNSKITLGDGVFVGDTAGSYLEGNWSSGNEVPMAAVVVGNRSNAYKFPATCTMTNTTVTVADGVEKPAFYAYGMESESGVDRTVTAAIHGGEKAAVTGAIQVLGQATLTVTGGTFTSDVSKYVPEKGYDCKEENGVYVVDADTELVVKPGDTGDENTTSATLDGNFSGDSGDGDISDSGNSGASGEVAGNTVTVTLPKNEAATTATLNVTASTAKSLADNGGSLTVKSGVGTLAVDNGALKAMAAGAGENAVALSIEKKDSAENTAAYELTATAGEKDVFTPESSGGSVQVTVPVPDNSITADNVWVYYLGPDGAELVEDATVDEDGNVVWTVEHFSTYFITGEAQTTSVTVTEAGESSTTTYADFGAALESLSEKEGDVTVKLLDDVSMKQKVTINKNVTINGGGYTITGDADVVSVCFEVTGGTFTIKDATLDGFGKDAATNSGVAVIKVPANAAGTTKVVATDVDVTNYCRSAYDIRSGSFEITGGTLDSGEGAGGENSRLTKGILAGLGTNQVTGTVKGVTITNSASNYADWSSAGIEIMTNAAVTVEGGSIENVQNGIHVDNYWSAGVENSAAAVTVQDVDITATNNAIILFGKEEGGVGAASAAVTGGSLTGGVKIQDGTAGQETVSLSGVTLTGDVTNENGKVTIENAKVTGNITNEGEDAVLAVEDTAIRGSAPAENAPGVSYVDTTVNGEPVGEVTTPGDDDEDDDTPDTPDTPGGGNGGGGGGGGGSVTRYEVSAPAADNGRVTVSPASTSKGQTVTITVTPDEGYELASLTVTDKDGKAVTLTDKGDGKYTFTMPGGKVTVTARFRAVEPTPVVLPFTDVVQGAWYYDAVVYAYQNGLMEGTGDTVFAPGMTTTRSMLATLLYRLEGEPAVSGAAVFTDVPAGAWYTDAVAWAAREGVVNGVGDGTAFAPDAPITREQMAVMLYRYAQYKGYDVSQGGMAAREYADYGQVAGWARYAMDWAVAAGLITGTSDTTLSPQGQATRAEIATILMRFAEKYVSAE